MRISIIEPGELDGAAFLTRWPSALGGVEANPALLRFFDVETEAPPWGGEEVRRAVRDLLRAGGFKPTGRNKPSSEYLRKAVADGRFSSENGINPAVDAGNVVSFRSGLPISVVDADRCREPLRIAVCPAGTRYVFNPAGQVIDVSGLISLHDEEGPCAGPVKDCQRTKTSAETTATLSVVWGTVRLPGHTAATVAWYHSLLGDAGAVVEPVEISRA